MPFDITVIRILHAIIEVAMLMLAGRGVFWIFGPKARQGNFGYDMLTIGTMPFIKATRKIMPKFVRDAYVPGVAFFLVFLMWIGLGIAKAAMCVAHGIAECSV